VATVVLVHGAGHTSRVWAKVQVALTRPSVAVDLPGRHDRPADITRVTVDAAAESIAADVDHVAAGPLVLVGHSVGGIVLPALAARLASRVSHLVFVAGLIAPDGACVADTVRPRERDRLDDVLRELRTAYGNHVFRPIDGRDPDRGGLLVITDARVAMGIDSLNYMAQTVRWAGVDPRLPRTFVRCTQDAIQPPELQTRLIENCAATTVVDLESGHTPALEVPDALAAILDGIAGAPTRTGFRHTADSQLDEV
jgi:pimeloyl-ACP methyl ester carboxylesterase